VNLENIVYNWDRWI